MGKYLTVLKISFQNIFEYRWNLLIGRFRQVILLLTLYYLWSTIFVGNSQLFGFNLVQMITYVYIVHILRSVVLDTRSDNIGDEIAGDGKFLSYLLKPVNYFKYWLSVDLAYKVVNLTLTLLELTVITQILHIKIFLQTNPVNLSLFLISTILGGLTYFLLISWVNFIAFWTTQFWGARFALTLLLEFTSGAFFPLSILPQTFQQALNLTPFPSLIYFPAKIYLGQLSITEISSGLLIQIIWLVLFFYLARLTWLRGLKVYEAFGG
ncbi:ABC-2 family transporter protein [Candidatus Daviesbacteria bacterium]|nr:ABC-2 family transporter protein [Candidatus Daviesbacteria bacterium]